MNLNKKQYALMVAFIVTLVLGFVLGRIQNVDLTKNVAAEKKPAVEALAEPERIKAFVDGVLKSSYDVDNHGTHTNNGQITPTVNCKTICDSDYQSCCADCFRGDILLMGGCLAECKTDHCKEDCK